MFPEFCWSMFQHLRCETDIIPTLTHLQPKYRTTQLRQTPQRFTQNFRLLEMLNKTGTQSLQHGCAIIFMRLHHNMLSSGSEQKKTASLLLCIQHQIPHTSHLSTFQRFQDQNHNVSNDFFFTHGMFQTCIKYFFHSFIRLVNCDTWAGKANGVINLAENKRSELSSRH